jgi:hypothetical protein
MPASLLTSTEGLRRSPQARRATTLPGPWPGTRVARAPCRCCLGLESGGRRLSARRIGGGGARDAVAPHYAPRTIPALADIASRSIPPGTGGRLWSSLRAITDLDRALNRQNRAPRNLAVRPTSPPKFVCLPARTRGNDAALLPPSISMSDGGVLRPCQERLSEQEKSCTSEGL